MIVGYDTLCSCSRDHPGPVTSPVTQMETSTRRTWFTAARMKRIAIGIVTVDLVLLVLWFAGSIHIAVNFGIDCYQESAITHFLILIHFALGMYITNMQGMIANAQYEAREKGRELKVLPYQAYNLLTWIFTALISTLGDTTLLTWAGQDLSLHPEGTDECHEARLLHIAFDSIALTVSLLTVLWFVVFAACTVKPQRQSRRD